MYLYIDNSSVNELLLSYALNTKWVSIVFSTEENPDILFYINKALKANRRSLKDLTGLAVRIGQGRFTATRVAVTIANALAFVLRIPVIGVGEARLDHLIQKIKKTPLGRYVSAKYSGEANIGRNTLTP